MLSVLQTCVCDVCVECIAMYRGHGTHVEEDQLHASVAGVIERVNRLVSVHPYKLRSVSLLAKSEQYCLEMDCLVIYLLSSLKPTVLTKLVVLVLTGGFNLYGFISVFPTK